MSDPQKQQEENAFTSPSISVPVIIQCDDTMSVTNGGGVGGKLEENGGSSIITVLGVDGDEKDNYGNGSTSTLSIRKLSSSEVPGGDGNGGVNKMLLGADLVQKAASLAMPPPLSTTVKKARNLVSPGMSMVKWMKIQESRERPPTRKKISLSEIAKHNTESDCWMVIRNCVYDVTEYLPYHPGGIPELMKGAGKDATSLFNEVHRWVNFDSILRSCLLGYLQIDVGESFDEIDEDMDVDEFNNSLVPASKKQMLPMARLSQDDSTLVFQVDCMEDDELSEDNWSVSILNRERFLLKVILKPPELWIAHVKLLQSLNDDSLAVSFQNSSKRLVVAFKKPSIGKWKSLGAPLQNNNLLLDSRQLQIDDFCCGTIVEKQELTHDVILIGVEIVPSSLVGVPVGFHVKLRLHEAGVARKYTPVNSSIIEQLETDSSLQKSEEQNRRVLYFIIKIYPVGLLTKELGLLNVTSHLEVGAVAGRFEPTFLKNCDTLALFAGGSGVTPFVRIIKFLGKRSISYPVQRILLIFFNHTEADIIWRDQWEALTSTWSKFHFFPVISNPDLASWNGLTGRVDNVILFETILTQMFKKELDVSQINLVQCQFGRFKSMICGSSGFNEACVSMLKTQSIVNFNANDEDLFIF